MRRGTVIAVISAAFVLIAGILLLTLLPEKDEEPESPPAQQPGRETGSLIQVTYLDVDSVVMMPRGKAQYTLQVDHSDPENRDIKLVAEDAIFPGMPFVIYTIYSNPTSLLHLTRVAEDADDGQLALYGLDDPVLLWQINMLDGTSEEFALGLRLAAGSGNYIRNTDSRDVYILNDAAVSFLLMDINNIYDIFFFPYPPSGEEYETWDLIEYLLLERPGGETIELSRRDDEEWFNSPPGVSRYRLLQPFTSECNDTTVKSTILEPVTGLIPEQVISVKPDDLSPYGLDSPVRLTVSAPGWEGTLLIGNRDNAARGQYIMIEGHDAVLFDPHGNYGFVNLEPAQLRSQMTWLHYIDTVSSVTFELEGVTRVLNIDHPAPGSDDKLNGRLDGTEIGESNTRRLYASLLGISASGSTGEPVPGGTPAYRFTMNFTDGKSRTLELFIISDSQFLMVLDGESLGLYTTRLQLQVSLLSKFETLDSGGNLPI